MSEASKDQRKKDKSASSAISNQTEWMDGFRDFLIVLMPIVTFGIMFGAASSAAGYSIGISVWNSAAVFAGASQFVFLEVYKEGIPAWSVVLAVFAVNFRHILYSAAIADKLRHFTKWQKFFGFFLLTDLQFATTENRYSNFKGKRVITPSYYFGFGIFCYALWIIGTLIGAIFGALIKDPSLIGLDFVLPIYFLSILMGFRKRARFLPVVLVSGAVSLLVKNTLGAPWHISFGALAGISAAVMFSIIYPTKPDIAIDDDEEAPLV
jgi:4-azaleucine resistance transporter AzlC